MASTFVDYGVGSERYEGYISYPEQRVRSACVLVAHDWSGAGQLSYTMADELARLGYVGFAIDLYGKGRRGNSAETSAALMQPFIENRSLIRQRFQLAIERARGDPHVDPDALGAIGCCFGGLCVLDMARNGPEMKGVVSIHGVLKPPGRAPNARISSKILILHGNDDPWAPPEDLQAIHRELTEAGADWQTHIFGHAMHAFTVPYANDAKAGLRYEPAATARSWALVRGFLQETFTPHAG